MANRIYKTAGGKAASPSQCGMSVLPSHGSPALQQGRATTHVCARSRLLACAVRRLSLPRALHRADEVHRVGHAGEIRPPPERSATFQSAQVAWDGRLIYDCLAIYLPNVAAALSYAEHTIRELLRSITIIIRARSPYPPVFSMGRKVELPANHGKLPADSRISGNFANETRYRRPARFRCVRFPVLGPPPSGAHN